MSSDVTTSATLDTTGEPTPTEISVDSYEYGDLADDLELTVRLGDAIVSVALTPADAEQLAKTILEEADAAASE